MQRLIDLFFDIPAAWALGAVFFLTCAEASLFFGFVIPGEITVVLGGVLFHQRLLRDCRSQDPRNEEQREHSLAQGVGLGSRRGDDPDSGPWRHGL
jgi:hypothetical protein